MENFSNETIDTFNLPRFEEAELAPLHPSYLTVIWCNIATFFGIVAIIAGLLFYFIEEGKEYWLPTAIGYSVILIFTIIVRVISFKNKAFAFREHDVIYRTGAISITTEIIPYNRIQHVAQHEGLVARWLGLATIEIFTAGGTAGDIKIPGLEKVHASAIKQLLINKMDKPVENPKENNIYDRAYDDVHNNDVISHETENEE